MTKEIAKKESTELANAYGDMGGAGFEDTTGADLSIPFINLLQSNSPTVQDELIEGAKIGDMLNTVTQELIKGDKGFVFVPVHKEEKWNEWIPRNKGGGFVEAHDPHSDLVKKVIAKNGGSRIPSKGDDGKRISFKTPNGNELIETYNVFGLILDEDGKEMESFAVVPFTSTKIKPYRNWVTSMYLIKGKPPIFANRAIIRTVKQKNDDGTYGNYTISPLKDSWVNSLINPTTESDLLMAAKDFREMVLSGMATADVNSMKDQAADTSVKSGVKADDSEEVPF